VLVIFVLRTRRNPPASPPHHHLRVAVVVLAVVLPLALLAAWFGFVPPSVAFLFAIAGLSVSYLLLAQGAKWGSTACGSRPASLRRTPYLGRAVRP
jgi:hypothetical protein